MLVRFLGATADTPVVQSLRLIKILAGSRCHTRPFDQGKPMRATGLYSTSLAVLHTLVQSWPLVVQTI